MLHRIFLVDLNNMFTTGPSLLWNIGFTALLTSFGLEITGQILQVSLIQVLA